MKSYATTRGEVGLVGSGTSWQKIVTGNGRMYVRGLVRKLFSNSTYMAESEFYKEGSDVGASDGNDG